MPAVDGVAETSGGTQKIVDDIQDHSGVQVDRVSEARNEIRRGLGQTFKKANLNKSGEAHKDPIDAAIVRKVTSNKAKKAADIDDEDVAEDPFKGV